MVIEFKGTKNKYSSTESDWNVYYERCIGEPGVTGITVMPDGNWNGNQTIAICYNKNTVNSNGYLTYEEAEANAKLISKAPKMLKLLVKILKVQEENYNDAVKTLSELNNLSEEIKDLLIAATKI